jgi:hypothetical protein
MLLSVKVFKKTFDRQKEVSSLRDFSVLIILLSTNILPLRGSPVRDLMWVEKN